MADTINWAKTSNEQLKIALEGNSEAQKAFNDAINEGLPVEDAFNEALAKTTSEQERADIVAKFLNSTYGESKKTYDEMNGSITSTNEAQLRLKETQSRLGQTMAPVTTAFTNFKAQALEAISPLVEKLANSLMNLITWLQAHPTVLSIVTSAVTALAVAFGVLATAMGIQALINGVTKAMSALNLTMLSNPYLLVGAAIAGLVAGLVIYTTTTKDAQTETEKMCAEMDELNESIRESADAYDEAKQARDEAMQGTEHEFGYYKQLADELANITDENGKVKKGYEERANTITGILSDALGEEITTDQLVADGKQKVIDKINQLILTKKAEIQLQANEQAYADAIKNSASAVNDYMTAKKNAKTVDDELAKAQKELTKVQEENAYLLERGTNGAQATYYARTAEAQKKVNELTEQQKENNKAVKEAEGVYLGYQTTIQNYEGLSSAIIEGDSAKINTAVNNLVNNFITAETGTKKSLGKQVTNAKSMLENLKLALAEGAPGVTQEMVDNAQDLVNRATAEYNKLVGKGKNAGEKSGKAVADGVKSKEKDAEKAGKDVSDKAKSGAKSVDAKSSGEKVGKDITSGVNAKQTDAEKAGQNVGNKAKSGAGSVDAKSSGEKLGQSVVTGLNAKQGPVNTAGKTLGKKAKSGVDSVKTKSSGENFALGFIGGMDAKHTSIWQAAWNLGKKALTALSSSIQEGSPSRLTKKSGGFFGEGFEIGIKDSISGVLDSVDLLVSDVKDAFLGKDGFDIHSPSRYMEDEVGVQIVAGLIEGVNKEKNNAKKSAQELGELYLKELESTISKKRDFKEVAVGDEIFLWSQLLKKFEKGSENYKNVELKLFDAHKRFVDDMRKTNAMSVQDEIAYWANLSATCEDGSVLYKYIMEQHGTAVKEYEDSLVKNHEDYVKQLKDDNRMSLSDEIQYWKKLLKQTEKGSDNYYKVYNKMVEAEKNLTEESTKLQTNYLNDVQKVKDDLIKNIQSVTDAYDKAVDDRRKSIVSSMGLFDAFKADKDIDKYTLTMNLESQVEALKDWDNVLDELSNRKGLKNSNLLSDLQNMGVDSIGTLKQINSMSDEELQNYINLYNEKSQIATNRAIAENEALKAESERQIQQLTNEANRQLNELETVYNQNLTSLGITTADRSYNIGRNIVQGLMSGISSETPNFQSYLTGFFSSIVSNAKNALQIYSPSRVFANEVGKQIPAGIAKGISDNSGIANKAIRGMTDDLVNESSLLNGATITRKLNTTFSATLGNGRTLSDVMNTMIDCSNKIYDRLNRLQIVLDSGTLVGETIDKIDAGLADRQILTARGL